MNICQWCPGGGEIVFFFVPGDGELTSNIKKKMQIPGGGGGRGHGNRWN